MIVWYPGVSSESHGLGRSSVFQRHSKALASERSRQKLRCQNALLRTSFLSWECIAVEGTHGNEGLLLGRPPEEPDQPITENSLLEVLDGIVMMYNLSVHQQLGKVSVTCCAGIHSPNVHASTPTVFCLFSDCVCPVLLPASAGDVVVCLYV